jgi:lysyl-tRNA synthetase class I
MSSFICEYCGANIIDSEKEYKTECKHYPFENICPKCKSKEVDIIDRTDESIEYECQECFHIFEIFE